MLFSFDFCFNGKCVHSLFKAMVSFFVLWPVTTIKQRGLTKTARPLAELRLLNADKWWFGPVDGFDVQMPYRIVRFL